MEENGEGWLVFAAIVLGIAGIMRIFDAIWAFSYHGALPENLENAIFGHSLKTYGWVYLVVGIVLIVCAGGVVARSQISRWIGVFAGAVMAISAIWWMPYDGKPPRTAPTRLHCSNPRTRPVNPI